MHVRKLLVFTGATLFTTSKFAAACLNDATAAACGCVSRVMEHLSSPAGACATVGSLGTSGTFGTLGGGGEGPGPTHVDIQNFLFAPDTILIKPNTTVRWTNLDFTAHTSTHATTWDSGALANNQFFDFTFTGSNAGVQYNYICTIHPFMEGNVRVARFGDANVDGNVNVNDFTILASHFGQTGQIWETGDFNGDGIVNVNDFTLLASNFGQPIQPGGSIMIDFGSNFGANLVPEPASGALLLVLLPLRRRKSQ